MRPSARLASTWRCRERLEICAEDWTYPPAEEPPTLEQARSEAMRTARGLHHPDTFSERSTTRDAFRTVEQIDALVVGLWAYRCAVIEFIDVAEVAS